MRINNNLTIKIVHTLSFDSIYPLSTIALALAVNNYLGHSYEPNQLLLQSPPLINQIKAIVFLIGQKFYLLFFLFYFIVK